MMLYFWSDRRPGEPDILGPLKDLTLVITDLADSPAYVAAAPPGGWTHELLDAKARELQDFTAPNGANAFLGTEYVGSTEA